MMQSAAQPPHPVRRWQWPLHLADYDRTAGLRAAEVAALAALQAAYDRRNHARDDEHLQTLERVVTPLDDALRVLGGTRQLCARNWFLREMHARQITFWAWTPADWSQLIDQVVPEQYRMLVLGVAYLLCDFRDLRALQRRVHVNELAVYVFGPGPVAQAVQQVYAHLTTWGYHDQTTFRNCLCRILLANGSPCLEDLTLEVLITIRAQHLPHHHQCLVCGISQALVALGILAHPLSFFRDRAQLRQGAVTVDGIAPEWLEWCQRWYDTSTLETRGDYYALLLRIGRWLTLAHPEITSPQQWTREVAADFVAAVLRLRVGDWAITTQPVRNQGKPITPRTKEQYIAVARTFFQNCQDWEWIRPRFVPHRVFATPRAVAAAIGPAPRDIANDIWAKLLAAGLALTSEDLPRAYGGDDGCFYPVEMVRAVAVVWLFAGLRSDEIRRLRVGCVRWQPQDTMLPVSGEPLSKDVVCFLDVPVNKTSTAYTKPVDRYVGLAIEAWERVRPHQPPALDAKTSELVDFLFMVRKKRLGEPYLNATLIPMLCSKAGVPEADAKGSITSHRARSTIATQLYNAAEPMTLEELQAWLGHTSPETTRHYAQITPTKLARSYSDAGYFERNLRTIEVLIDQQAVLNGDATKGLPWKYYDLGHGYCTYDFFEQCAHRKACAQCAFYRPKHAYLALLLEKKEHLLHMRRAIPLTDLELATVEGDLVATDTLIAQLHDVPTPAGPTPRGLKEREEGS